MASNAQLAAAAVGGAAVAYALTKLSAPKRPSVPHGVVLYYHSACKGFTGRADAIVRMLEHAGCKYECKTPSEVPPSYETERGCFAVPFVTFPDGVVLSQSQAIHQHLGKTLGLYPTTPEGEAQAMQVALNAADLISEGAKKLKENPERLKKWLGVFEGTLKKSGSGYFVGGGLTYADFACYSWLKLALSLADKKDFPLIDAFVERMDSLPSMKAFNATGVVLLPASMMP